MKDKENERTVDGAEATEPKTKPEIEKIYEELGEQELASAMGGLRRPPAAIFYE